MISKPKPEIFFTPFILRPLIDMNINNNNNSKYIWTPEMREISGMGGSYEDSCKRMIIAGLEFWDTQTESFNPRYKGFKDVYGICMDDNEDAKKLSDVLITTVSGCSGAMHQAAISHIFFIKRNGWEKYKQEMMSKEKKDEQ
ncbi:MAG TPA: hypothetical protein VFG90_08255 [Nitrososphaeraceae archaeon]|nr:hypothetical protein [Nitrososphaeraceae archaeon]